MTKNYSVIWCAIAFALPATVFGGVAYEDPAGGWFYTYDGADDLAAAAGSGFASLDGTWSHDNGSDEWDGSPIGSGRPGGAMSIEEDDADYLRIQDTGDPRDYAMDDPGSNRKVYLGHDITAEGAADDFLDEGVTLSFRVRVPTTGPLDDLHPDGGGGITSWPTEADGYGLHDGGKSFFTLHQNNPGANISFALANDTEDSLNFNGPGLAMNSLNGTVATADVDWQGGEGTPNLYDVDDISEWHEFWINILQDPTGEGTHLVIVRADGATEENLFTVTAGNGNDFSGISYLAMGLGATPQHGVVDIDFVSWAAGIHDAVPKQTGLACDFDGDGACGVGDVDLLMIEVGTAAKAGGAVAGPAPTPFDLTSDGVVDDLDRDEWLALAAEENGLSAPYQLGDTNLDLIVDATDLNEVGISWQVADEHRWSKGNFTGGGVNAPDLNEVGINWQQRHPDAPAGAAVPEPNAVLLTMAGMVGLLMLSRRR